MYDIITTTIECAPELSREGITKLAADVTGKRGLKYDLITINYSGGASRYAATLIGKTAQASELVAAKDEFMARLSEAGMDPNAFGYILEEQAIDVATTVGKWSLAGFLAWKGAPIVIGAAVAALLGLDWKKIWRSF